MQEQELGEVGNPRVQKLKLSDIIVRTRLSYERLKSYMCEPVTC